MNLENTSGQIEISYLRGGRTNTEKEIRVDFVIYKVEFFGCAVRRRCTNHEEKPGTRW